MKNKFTIAFFLLPAILLTGTGYAQTGIGTQTPDINAILDISSTQKGLLLPRLNAAQLSTLTATLTTAQAGMMVTDATTSRTVYWSGTGWKAFSGNTATATSPLTVSSTNTLALNPGTAVGDLITWDGANWINLQPAQHFTITVENRQPYLALNYCIAMVGIFPSRSSDQPFLSEIEIYSFGFPPKGWAFCNGQLLPINQNQALFSLLGTTYGGNGITTFALPNLQGRVPLHFGNGAGLSPYVLGQAAGSETNTISK